MPCSLGTGFLATQITRSSLGTRGPHKVINRVGRIRSFWKSNYDLVIYTPDTVTVPVVPSTKDSFLTCIAALLRQIQMSAPKGMLVDARSEAYEHDNADESIPSSGLGSSNITRQHKHISPCFRCFHTRSDYMILYSLIAKKHEQIVKSCVL